MLRLTSEGDLLLALITRGQRRSAYRSGLRSGVIGNRRGGASAPVTGVSDRIWRRQMPAGDAQRTWFPEMVEELRRRWRADLSPIDLVNLRDDLDAMLQRIRSARSIITPVIRCRSCGHVGPAAEPDVSVRAAILALERFGIGSAEDVKRLHKRWAAYIKIHGLDRHGKPADAKMATRECRH